VSQQQTTIKVPDVDLIRPVGSGGFGQVWMATNRTTGKLLAVKVIALQQTGETAAAAREINSLVRLEANVRCEHPNLLQIHHVGKTASHLFYVMDLADDAAGGPASDRPDYRPATLQTWLENEGNKGKGVSCPPEVCLEYARQLLAGLAALHAAGMVHRDVKPANCLFVGGQLKLADFGLLTEAHPLVSQLGTQNYMPPDGRMDMRADVYAAGLVIYEIMTGLPVDEFPRLGPQAQQVGANPILMTLLRLVLRACEREPAKRFADARAMLAELEQTSGATPRLPRRRMLATVLAAGILAAAGLCAWIFLPRRVSVSFVTQPFEATIYLDGNLLVDSKGRPYTTPCTVDGLPARAHRVLFEYKGKRLSESGDYDFARTRQIGRRISP
jgi:eukaryotic-like serine/threonine-protein kinase